MKVNALVVPMFSSLYKIMFFVTHFCYIKIPKCVAKCNLWHSLRHKNFSRCRYHKILQHFWKMCHKIYDAKQKNVANFIAIHEFGKTIFAKFAIFFAIICETSFATHFMCCNYVRFFVTSFVMIHWLFQIVSQIHCSWDFKLQHKVVIICNNF